MTTEDPTIKRIGNRIFRATAGLGGIDLHEYKDGYWTPSLVDWPREEMAEQFAAAERELADNRQRAGWKPRPS